MKKTLIVKIIVLWWNEGKLSLIPTKTIIEYNNIKTSIALLYYTHTLTDIPNIDDDGTFENLKHTHVSAQNLLSINYIIHESRR